ncbi:MAG: hypothetical protein P1U46_01475 [Patescibacteria group bacterium]|nr:hypothetical protein [Patescibacteria group bacterium]
MFKEIFRSTKTPTKKIENILDDPNSKIGVFFDSVILSLVLIFPLFLIFESI